MAAVTSRDLVIDPGCGDGSILLAAATRHGARGIGVDVAPALLAEARRQTETRGVTHLLRFEQQDLFTADLSAATFITLYLLDSLNVRLRPKILRECRPGTRVVSYSFEMGEWEADAHTPIAANGVFLWVVPANFSGLWEFSKADRGDGVASLSIQQTFQKISGEMVFQGRRLPLASGRVIGERFEAAVHTPSPHGRLRITGHLAGEGMEATVVSDDGQTSWTARRIADSRRPLE